MTQSTKELVHAFKARGGKVVIIPRGVTGDIKYKSLFKQGRAYSRKRKEAFQVRLNATAHGREKPGCRAYAAVDVFMQFRNEKGI